MRQEERRRWLIQALMDENPDYSQTFAIPQAEDEQRRLLRALLNLRPPMPASPEFLRVQNAYLQEELARRGVVDGEALPELRSGVCLWRGDITRLRCDAIVNAANSALLGCFCPNHGCIDNAIHTFSGWRAMKSWLSRGGWRPRERQKLRLHSTCPAAMCCTPWGPLCTGT